VRRLGAACTGAQRVDVSDCYTQVLRLAFPVALLTVSSGSGCSVAKSSG
jgi:hypothetical protein